MKRVAKGGLAIVISWAFAASGPGVVSQTAEDSKSSGLLTEQEEAPGGGTRIRVSTPELRLIAKGERSLDLQVQCLHPKADRQVPDQCLVYLTSSSPSQRYRDHDTPFKIDVDGVNAGEGPFKSYKVLHEGSAVVEPLISFWSWEDLTKIASGKDVTITLAGERIPVPREAVSAVDRMVRYFDK